MFESKLRILFLCFSLFSLNNNPVFAEKTIPDLETNSSQNITQAKYSHDNHLNNLGWFNDDKLSPAGRVALDFIQQSARHGLDPEDYQLSVLNQRLADCQTDNYQEFDSLLTQNLIAVIHDLKNGRFDPRLTDPSWHIPQTQFDAKAFLLKARSAENFSARLDTLIPKNRQYQKLLQALAKYQEYARQQSWPAVPKTNSLLRTGDRHPHLKIIQARLAAEDDFLALTHAVKSDIYDPLLELAVKRFQTRYGLKVDGIIGPQTVRAMNITADYRVKQIRASLERYRWLPDLGERYVLINTANHHLQAIDNNQVVLDMKVIVGRKSRQTPSFLSQINHVVFNPYWNVPNKLARLDLLPKQQEDAHYLQRQGFKVFRINSNIKTELPVESINWQNYSSRETLPFTLRQQPGDHNALGRIKFLFPNPWQIYLHDTPHQSLFDEAHRAFSSGCIRVEQPLMLADFIIEDPQKQQVVTRGIASKKNGGLKLNPLTTLYVMYITVAVSDNQVVFSPDHYQRDQRMIKHLY